MDNFSRLFIQAFSWLDSLTTAPAEAKVECEYLTWPIHQFHVTLVLVICLLLLRCFPLYFKYCASNSWRPTIRNEPKSSKTGAGAVTHKKELLWKAKLNAKCFRCWSFIKTCDLLTWLALCAACSWALFMQNLQKGHSNRLLSFSQVRDFQKGVVRTFLNWPAPVLTRFDDSSSKPWTASQLVENYECSTQRRYSSDAKATERRRSLGLLTLSCRFHNNHVMRNEFGE